MVHNQEDDDLMGGTTSYMHDSLNSNQVLNLSQLDKPLGNEKWQQNTNTNENYGQSQHTTNRDYLNIQSSATLKEPTNYNSNTKSATQGPDNELKQMTQLNLFN